MSRPLVAFVVVVAATITAGLLVACRTKPASRPHAAPPSGEAPAVPTASNEPTDARSHAPLAEPTREASNAVRDAVNGLAADLFARLAATPGNVVFSPASIEAALAMTAAGARANTAEEMHRVLHLGDDAQGTLDALGAALRRWDAPERAEGTLRVANRLFGERSYTFEPPYLAYVRDVYDAPLEALDFRGSFEPSRLHINGWVLAHTGERIRDLLPPGAVTSDTRLVLVNAVYLDAKWGSPFEPTATHARPFTLASGATVEVPTMHRRARYGVADVDGAQIVELPYRGGDLAMRFVLPPRGTSAAAFATRAHLSAAVTYEPTEILLAVPKFRLEPGAPVRLREHLVALGMRAAFDRRTADFSGIARPTNPDDRLVVSEAFHKAFIRVDEEGTEAAAATAVVMMRAGAAAPRPVREITFDRPFLFELVDLRTGAILFLGRVDDPRGE